MGEPQEMESTKLFSQEEKRDIKRRRNQYSQKIKTYGKKEDYLQAIRYELQLQEMCKRRRIQHKIKRSEDNLEFYIVYRIKRLHRELIRCFKEDLKLWLDYLEFCLQHGEIPDATKTVTDLTKEHPNVAKVWHIAADYQLHELKDVEEAINLLWKSLHYHNSDEKLLKKCFELELKFDQESRPIKLENVKIEEDCSPEDTEQLQQKARMLFEAASQRINNVYFYTDLIDIASKFDADSLQLQETIRQHLLKHFPDEEITWHYLAQGELAFTQESYYKARVKKSMERYEEGIKRCPTETMWSFYLDSMIDLQLDDIAMLDFKTACLREAFEKGHRSRLMSEKYYIKWMSIVPEEEEDSILQKGLAVLPESIELCKVQLRKWILEDVEGDCASKIEDIFERSASVLPSKSLPLFNMYLQYLLLRSSNENVERFFKRAVKRHANISQPMKLEYIDWALFVYGRDRASQVYTTLAMQEPFCKELHAKMALIESLQAVPNVEAWADVYKLACRQFGQTDAQVWVDWVKFDARWLRGQNCEKIRKKAIKTLPELLKDVFVKSYADAMASTAKT